MKMEAQIRMANVDDIVPNKFQPRTEFVPEAIQELASSIKVHGIIEPLVVRRVQDKYEIVTGERRLKAAQMINLNSVPVIVVDMDDNEAAEVAVIENIHRSDLSPIEEAKSFKRILDKGYLTPEQLSARMGLSQPALNDKLKLLLLDESVQEALQKKDITEEHAKSLMRLTDKMKQVDLLNDIVANKLTVKQVDEEVEKVINGYKQDSSLVGGINSDNKIDIDLSSQLDNSQDVGTGITPTEYQYRSKIKDNGKKPLFFNELEESPATMEDPTLSFGFSTFKNNDEDIEDSIVDLDEELDEEVEKPTAVSEAYQEEIDTMYNFIVKTPRDLTKAIHKLLGQAVENGVDLKSEEFNFTDIYQVLIKIAKDKAEDEAAEKQDGVQAEVKVE